MSFKIDKQTLDDLAVFSTGPVSYTHLAEERTVILSTHILPEVQATCDHILMVEHGKLVFDGSVDEFDNYIVPSTIFLSLANAPSVDVLKTVEGITKIEEFGGGRFRIHFSDAQEVMERLVEQMCIRDRHGCVPLA